MSFLSKIVTKQNHLSLRTHQLYFEFLVNGHTVIPLLKFIRFYSSLITLDPRLCPNSRPIVKWSVFTFIDNLLLQMDGQIASRRLNPMSKLVHIPVLHLGRVIVIHSTIFQRDISLFSLERAYKNMSKWSKNKNSVHRIRFYTTYTYLILV